MDLHNTYYNDLFKMKEPMHVLYSKYYELHRLKHSSKSVKRRIFTQRISQYHRSVGKAIRTPYSGKPGKRKGNSIILVPQ